MLGRRARMRARRGDARAPRRRAREMQPRCGRGAAWQCWASGRVLQQTPSCARRAARMRAVPARHVCARTTHSKHTRVCLHQVTITHDGKTVTLDVPESQTILEAALDKRVDLPHDCKLGVSRGQSRGGAGARVTRGRAGSGR
jgi:hypothetical protein